MIIPPPKSLADLFPIEHVSRWGILCPLRFSNSVSKFYSVTRVDPADGNSKQAYIKDLVRIAEKEHVDLFVPCSGAGTTIEDAIAAEIMRRKSNIDTIIQDPDLAQHLHEKVGYPVFEPYSSSSTY